MCKVYVRRLGRSVELTNLFENVRSGDTGTGRMVSHSGLCPSCQEVRSRTTSVVGSGLDGSDKRGGTGRKGTFGDVSENRTEKGRHGVGTHRTVPHRGRTPSRLFDTKDTGSRGLDNRSDIDLLLFWM